MFWSCLGLVTLVAAIDPDCQALIDANLQTLGLIRTIQVNYTITGRNERPTEVFWSREGNRERIQQVGGHLEPTPDGRPRNLSDVLIDDGVYKYLRNWDPRNPQKITPTKPGTVRAATGPHTNVNASLVTPSRQLLFEVEYKPRRTLAELAKVSPKITYQGKVELEGRELRLISLEYPEDAIYKMGKRDIDVYLDPAAGYMVRKMVGHIPNWIVSNGPPVNVVHAHEVLEFKDFGGGIFVPIKIRHGEADKWLSETVVKSIKINEPIPPETFELNWPKYAQVRHLPPVNGRIKIEVWGDGKPIRETKGLADIYALEAELRKDPVIAAELGPLPGAPRPPSTSTMVKLSIALGTLVTIMIGLVLYRRIREQAAA